MKIRRVIFAFMACLLLSVSLISAVNQTEEAAKINQAYTWLRNTINEKGCNELSTEEKIFALLSIGKCKQELISDMDSNNCWPASKCNLKTTALATLALNSAGTDTKNQKEWLLNRKKIPQDMEWYLQIETSEPSTCSIAYDSNVYDIHIDEYKKISALPGSHDSCFSVSSNKYWLEISFYDQNKCYGKNFAISCDKSFQTNLLFTSSDSDVISIYEKTSSASAGGTTAERVDSFCFGLSPGCDYEGSLWTALVLDILKEDVKAYLPYLISMEELSQNKKYFPEVFLYSMTDDNDYRNKILAEQRFNQFWQVSSDRIYDTALALYPFGGITSEITEKNNAKKWLLSIQDEEGHWERNILNTAFILSSIWPKIPETVVPSEDCVSSGNYCLLNRQCTSSGGNILENYEGCSFGYICCHKPYELKTCEEMHGEICYSDEECSVSTVPSSDSDGNCCLGVCNKREEIPSPTPSVSMCEQKGGTCRTQCFNSEIENRGYTSSCESYKICCVEKEGGGYWWIILLSVLIVLVVLAIVFRNHLRKFIFKIKQNFGGKGSSYPSTKGTFPPRGPPPQGYAPIHSQRRPIQNPNYPLRQQSKLKSQHELDDVLKKLKDMGR